MTSHRVFWAICLPSEIKEKLEEYQKKYLSPEFFRKVKPDALHLTVLFIGSVKDREILSLQVIGKQLTSPLSPFPVSFNKITYGPSSSRPRLVWLEGEHSPILSELRNKMEQQLKRYHISFHQENRPLKPHITLARIRKGISYQQLPPSSYIEKHLELQFTARELSLMESHLRPSGAEYKQIAQFSFLA